MIGPDRTYYSPDDEPRYRELTRAGIEALEVYQQRLRALATETVRVRSTDGQVVVSASGGGQVSEVQIQPGALHRYSSTRLGDVVTRTVRAAQEKARAEYQREAERLQPPEIAAADNAFPSD